MPGHAKDTKQHVYTKTLHSIMCIPFPARQQVTPENLSTTTAKGLLCLFLLHALLPFLWYKYLLWILLCESIVTC
jgi:hypothetical protein